MRQTRQSEDLHHLELIHTVPGEDDGLRLDVFLKQIYKHKSREFFQREIARGAIKITRDVAEKTNRPGFWPGSRSLGRAKASTVLRFGDTVTIHTERVPEPVVDLNYKILHEDDSLLVIDKPGNLPVHPAGSFFFHTLLMHLKTRGYTKPLRHEQDYFLPHRIDRETSGILVIARTPEMCALLSSQFADRSTQKIYWALVHGRWNGNPSVIETPLATDPTSLIKLKMRIAEASDEPLEARTECKVIENAGNFTWVECIPKTGRQHQIRVHMASIGHPLVGDKLYSLTDEEAYRFYEPALRERESVILKSGDDPDPVRSLPDGLGSKLLLWRHALHAHRLEFTHPVSRKRLAFESAFPKDLQDFLARARENR